MTYRRYSITITPRRHASLPDKLLREFGCSITEPSNWNQGLTLERGLTFLDKDGRELESDVFTHIPIFTKTPKTKEKKEIEAIISNRIKSVYAVDITQLQISISEY